MLPIDQCCGSKTGDFYQNSASQAVPMTKGFKHLKIFKTKQVPVPFLSIF
jgi:hypothetical protein